MHSAQGQELTHRDMPVRVNGETKICTTRFSKPALTASRCGPDRSILSSSYLQLPGSRGKINDICKKQGQKVYKEPMDTASWINLQLGIFSPFILERALEKVVRAFLESRAQSAKFQAVSYSSFRANFFFQRRSKQDPDQPHKAPRVPRRKGHGQNNPESNCVLRQP